MSEFLSEQFWDALEERQDEIISQLDALNERIEAALADFDQPADPPPRQEAA